MTERTKILDRLFTNAERFIEELNAEYGKVSNQEMLRMLTYDQQRAYIDLLYSFRDTERRKPFDAAHQEIGKRLLKVAEQQGYEHAKEMDRETHTFFGTDTIERFYRLETSQAGMTQ